MVQQQDRHFIKSNESLTSALWLGGVALSCTRGLWDVKWHECHTASGFKWIKGFASIDAGLAFGALSCYCCCCSSFASVQIDKSCHFRHILPTEKLLRQRERHTHTPPMSWAANLHMLSLESNAMITIYNHYICQYHHKSSLLWRKQIAHIAHLQSRLIGNFRCFFPSFSSTVFCLHCLQFRACRFGWTIDPSKPIYGNFIANSITKVIILKCATQARPNVCVRAHIARIPCHPNRTCAVEWSG